MDKAFSRAFSRCGFTSPNPPVGAVLVKNGKIVSEGGTQFCGGDHAEICAINSAGSDAEGCDLYVTLEPCSHYGKTPPCVNRIIESGIKRVYLSVLDPNPEVSGEGVRILRDSGIQAFIAHDAIDAGIDLYRPFFTYMENKRPYVIHKSAITIDGFIADHNGDSKWISNSRSRFISHKLRGICDAVAVGKNTVLRDNPALTVRCGEFQAETKEKPVILGSEKFRLKKILEENYCCMENPKRIVFGFSDVFNREMKVFSDDNYTVYSQKDCAGEFAEFLKKNGKLKVFTGPSFIDDVLRDLYDQGIMTVLLEGGGGVASRFILEDRIDEEMLFAAPKIFSGGTKVMGESGLFTADSPVNLYDVSISLLDNDVLYHAYYRKKQDVYRYY